MIIETNIDLNTDCSLDLQRETGVYCILNTKNNKFYIGSVTPTKGSHRKNFRRRWQKHVGDLLKGKHCNTHLQGAFKADGRESFKFIILEIQSNAEEILTREQFWIDSTNCLDPDIGYNKYPFAICVNKDYIVSKDTKKKLKKSLTGKPRPTWMKLKYGKPIYQYSLDGEFIQEWYSATEAARVLNIHRTGIKDALKGRATRKTAGGYIWKYKNLNN